MTILSIYELKQKLTKNELNYNSCCSPTSRQFHFNYGYVLIHHFFKNYDASNSDLLDYLQASNLYKKVVPLIMSNTNKVASVEMVSVSDDNGIVDNVSDAVCLRLQQIDNLVFEIKTLLNTNKSYK